MGVHSNAVPSAAPAHAAASASAREEPWRVSSAIGVYVPAMKRKMAAWSAFSHRSAAAGDQRPRWYSALTANIMTSVTAYTDAANVARPAGADATSATPATSAPNGA